MDSRKFKMLHGVRVMIAMAHDRSPKEKMKTTSNDKDTPLQRDWTPALLQELVGVRSARLGAFRGALGVV